MIAGRRSGTILALALFAAGLAVAWFVYRGLEAPAGSGPSVAVADKQLAAANARPAGREFKLPPLSSFEDILERPVFSQSRRPKAGAPVVIRQDLALKMQGAIGADGEMRALLKPEGGGETVRLREGEEYQGWTLSEIGLWHVIFRRDDQEVRLETDYKEPPPPVRRRPGQPGVRQPQGAQDAQGDLLQNRQNQLRQQQRQQQLQQQQRQQQLRQQQQRQQQLLQQQQRQQQLLQQQRQQQLRQ